MRKNKDAGTRLRQGYVRQARDTETRRYPVETPIDRPFDRLTVLSKVDGLTVLRTVERLKAPSEAERQRRGEAQRERLEVWPDQVHRERHEQNM